LVCAFYPTVGGIIEIRKKDNLYEIERFEVKIKISNLPDTKEIQSVLQKKPDDFYAGKITMFDITATEESGVETAKQFFNRILKENKQ